MATLECYQVERRLLNLLLRCAKLSSQEDAHMGWTNSLSRDEAIENKPFTTLGEDLMNLKETAAFCGVSVVSLNDWIARGDIPNGIVIAGRRKWSKRNLIDFITYKVLEQQRLLNERKSA